MGFNLGQVRYRLKVTKEIQCKAFLHFKRFFDWLVLQEVGGALAYLPVPRALGGTLYMTQ